MGAKWPFSRLTRDRFFGLSRLFASSRGGRAHGDQVPSQVLPSHALQHEEAPDEALERSERSIHAGRVGRRRWLIASVQQLYGVSVAMAAVVVLLWRGPLVLLAAGALLLGMVVVAMAVFLVLARRSGAPRAGRGPHRGGGCHE